MSRFFATGSDSESEESSSADEITPKAPGTTFKQSVQFILNPVKFCLCRDLTQLLFLAVFFFPHRSLLLSDDEEDTKRVVRSAKDKRLVWNVQHIFETEQIVFVLHCFWTLSFINLRFEELTNFIKTIRNAMKIRDMAKCLEEFEQLCRAFLKSKNIVDKEGVPPFYIRLLADLEDYLNQVSSPELKLNSRDHI